MLLDIDRVAAERHMKSAAQGFALAQYNLGVASFDGRGVLASRSVTLEWFRKAAANNDSDAHKALAMLHQR